MTDYRLVPVEPTPEMVEAAADAHMPFGDMELAIRMAILAAPAVQVEPVGWVNSDELDNMLDDRTATLFPVRTGFHGKPVYTAPQPAEQKPALTKYQPCGCVICTCEHETQCQGCGAKHCGTHPVGQFSGPVYQQPAPDVSALVEELVEALELARIDLKEWLKSFPVAAREPTGKIIERIDAALASHRKQETSHDNQ